MGNPALERLFEDGLTALRKLRFNDAYDRFTEAMEMSPGLPEIYYNLGIASGRLLRWEEAAAFFRMALRVHCHPDAASTTHLGLALLHQRRWSEARVALRRALSRDGGLAQARAHLQDLEEFLANDGGDHALEHPALCEGWYDSMLDDFVGVDPVIVPKDEREALRAFIEKVFAAEPGGCDHTFAVTEEWAVKTDREPLGVARFLYGRNMRCDCQVLAEPQNPRAAPPPEAPPAASLV